MTIRTRLLFLLLPPITIFLILNSLFYYFEWSREALLIGSFVILLLIIGTVFAVAERITKPVRQLNQAALDIAAGDYEANIQVKGPKEIMELAHTLNTMSECLVEHMSRLKESSLIRERMYGEYECSLLLQYYMLQKEIEDFHSPHLAMRLISIPQSPLQKGLLLKVEKLMDEDSTSLGLFESQEQGFESLFQLNKLNRSKENFESFSLIECQFIDHYRVLRYHTRLLFPPLVWSVHHQQVKKGKHQEIVLNDLDMIFLYNSCFIDHFETEQAIEEWFAKVLRHFAVDGLDTIQVMLTNELSFLTKKQSTKQNFKIIGIQVRNQES